METLIVIISMIGFAYSFSYLITLGMVSLLISKNIPVSKSEFHGLFMLCGTGGLAAGLFSYLAGV